MKNTRLMTITATALALTATMAFAHPGEGARGGKHGRRGGAEFGARFAEKLNLTDAQKAQVRTFTQSFRQDNQALFQAHRDTMKQLREAKQAGDQAAADALKPTLQSQRTELKQRRQALKQQILAILTPEQRAQYEAFQAEREARRGQRGSRPDRNGNLD